MTISKQHKNPKISIIMAVHNGMPLGPQSKTRTASYAYLKEAVLSILNQTYRNFEFIIVDDASTDGTCKYLKKLKDKRIRILTNKKNEGLATSLNIALRQAQGDYVARMDADDISMSQRFKTQLEYLQRNPQIALCGSWVDLIDEEGKVIGEKKFPPSDSRIKNALKWYQPIVHPTFMARSNFYKQLGGYDKNFDFAEDYELLVRAMKKYKFANIPKKLLLWRLADDRRSRKFMKKVDLADFKVKLEILKSNYFGKMYLFYVAVKFLTTFFLPINLKVFVAKRLKFA